MLNLIEKLRAAKYCEVTHVQNGEPFEIIIQDPVFTEIGSYLDRFYAVNHLCTFRKISYL